MKSPNFCKCHVGFVMWKPEESFKQFIHKCIYLYLFLHTSYKIYILFHIGYVGIEKWCHNQIIVCLFWLVLLHTHTQKWLYIYGLYILKKSFTHTHTFYCIIIQNSMKCVVICIKFRFSTNANTMPFFWQMKRWKAFRKWPEFKNISIKYSIHNLYTSLQQLAKKTRNILKYIKYGFTLIFSFNGFAVYSKGRKKRKKYSVMEWGCRMVLFLWIVEG